jgi:hypothetical protein
MQEASSKLTIPHLIVLVECMGVAVPPKRSRGRRGHKQALFKAWSARNAPIRLMREIKREEVAA